jgi:hypothetical protein
MRLPQEPFGAPPEAAKPFLQTFAEILNKRKTSAYEDMTKDVQVVCGSACHAQSSRKRPYVVPSLERLPNL